MTNRQRAGLAMMIVAFAMSAAAQTVTGSGTAGTVAVFTGSGISSTVGSTSTPITVTSAGNVGIGTTTPTSLLSVGPSSQFQVGSTGSVTAPSMTVTGNVTAAAFSGSGSGLTSIPYSAITGAPAVGAASVFGRTGAVTAASGDYSVNQITGAAPLASPVFSGSVQVNGINSANGIYAGNGDNANASTVDVAIESWWGLGFKSTCCSGSGITWNYPIVFDTRAGNIYTEGNVGVGTTNPGNKLQVAGGRIYVGGDSTGVDYGVFGKDPGGNAFLDANMTGAGIGFYTNNSVKDEARMFINSSGNVGIGTTNPGATLEVNGTAKIDTSLSVGAGGITFSGQAGTQTTPWTGVLCGGDYAEAVNAKGSKKTYEPGDVLVIGDGDDGEVQKSAEPYSTMVSGIFATKPGVIGRRQSLVKDADEIPMAMVGIVPTKVTAENGPIHRGDLLVTSSTAGFAMKGTDRERMLGAVIGKAMGSLDSGTGVIEVLVTLQ